MEPVHCPESIEDSKSDVGGVAAVSFPKVTSKFFHGGKLNFNYDLGIIFSRKYFLMITFFYSMFLMFRNVHFTAKSFFLI